MITITNDLLPINPAYNDSIIEFETTATGTTSASITIDGKVFKVYGINNKYSYNFKNNVTVLINENKFKDAIVPNLYTSSIYDDSTLSYQLPVTIAIDGYSAETVTKNYKFLKNVEQLIDNKLKSSANNSVRILLPTNNYTDYNLPYFEGYPIDFSVYGISSGSTFYLKNTSSISTSDMYSSISNSTKRIFISDGANNEYLSNLIGLTNTVNKLELWVNNTFNSNLNIKRFDSKSGVYLKWFNASGSYSYWLFDDVVTETITTNTLDEINGDYDNIQNVSSTSQITGKKANKTLKLSTKFSEFEKDYLTSILTSPMVEMYIYDKPFQQIQTNSFIGVSLNDSSTSFNNKTGNYQMNLTITLPYYNTQTL